MKRVIGLGGIFFKSKDPKALNEWYKKHLGLPAEEWGVQFETQTLVKESPNAYQVWSAFKESTPYLAPSDKPFMFNFIVDDLHPLLAQLKEEGVTIVKEAEESEFGRFGWIMDPEGNKIELWEPPR